MDKKCVIFSAEVIRAFEEVEPSVSQTFIKDIQGP